MNGFSTDRFTVLNMSACMNKESDIHNKEGSHLTSTKITVSFTLDGLQNGIQFLHCIGTDLIRKRADGLITDLTTYKWSEERKTYLWKWSSEQHPNWPQDRPTTIYRLVWKENNVLEPNIQTNTNQSYHRGDGIWTMVPGIGNNDLPIERKRGRRTGLLILLPTQ